MRNLSAFVALLATGGSIVVSCAPAFVQQNEDLARAFLKAHADAQRLLPARPRDNHPLGYVESGRSDGPKVILIHGSPGSWTGFVRYLDDPTLQARAHLIAVDRPGYGRSGRGRPERSVRAQADLIHRVFDVGDPHQPVVLLGHSYGGPVVARLAMDADPRIRAAIIVAGAVDPDLEETKWMQYPADWWIFRWLVPTDLDVCNQEILALQAELRRMVPDWPRIRAPVHVVHGVEDDLVPVGNADFIAQHAADVRVQRIEGLNHFVPWLRYDLLQQAILDALERIEPAPLPVSDDASP